MSATRYSILVPVSNLQEAKMLLPLAEALARSRQGEVLALHVVLVPPGQRLSEGAVNVSRSRQALNNYLAQRAGTSQPVRSLVRATHDLWEAVWEVVVQENIDLLLLGWTSAAMPETTGGLLKHQRLLTPPCNVMFVHPRRDLQTFPAEGEPLRFLLAVRGGPNDGLALRITEALAAASGGNITLLHATGEAPRDAEEHIFTHFAPALRALRHLNRSVTVVGDVTEAISREASGHDVVVMGASQSTIAPDDWRGKRLQSILEQTEATLIIVKRKAPQTAELLLPERYSTSTERPLNVVVDRWFAERTFHSREFADIERLVRLKEDQGLSISLGLPALNEEETVGNVIRTVKTALMDDIPLLDEIVLIDSGSVDYTREIAADMGIPVCIHQEILPRHGAYQGKGEALWKSLYVLRGDIIAWIDTDIKNIHPRFVYGIIGPLLQHRDIQYVKGFYRRPLKQGDKMIAGGGGRVTELTARPLINLFYPELSGLIQPLSGEYAGRRSALERLPFFTGYGVESGLLIDMLDNYGLNAIAQVDLLQRVHHNQPLPSLSKMSFTIIQVFMQRLGKRHNITLLQEANLTMNLPRYTQTRFYLASEELRERERPPITEVPEYRRKFGLEEAPPAAHAPAQEGQPS